MEFIEPSSEPPPTVPISQCVRAGDLLFISGQIAKKEDGSPYIGDFDREVSRAIDALAGVLAAANATMRDVVKVTAFLSNSLLFDRFNLIYASRLPHRPARTTVVVNFGHPAVRVELEAIAYVGSTS